MQILGRLLDKTGYTYFFISWCRGRWWGRCWCLAWLARGICERGRGI